ncbi:MAG TPA: amidohydrolase family protein [Acidimicrobiales bacterium]|nr:amidohydrolase family protein [Acidimicrobiales bacterium]
MSDLVLREVVVDGRLVDVRVSGGAIVAIGRRLPARPGDEAVDGRRGALIPGLHDHHIHLLALAAAERSPLVGPPYVADADGFRGALVQAGRGLPPGEWIRAIGYHESVAGPIDRWRLDAVVADRPVRVQHRSGVAWVLNSAGLASAGIDEALDVAGLERDGEGRLTGRLLGLDRWLRDRLPSRAPPDLGVVGRRLAAYGVTGVTDLTPVADVEDLAPLVDAALDGSLPQRVTASGGPRLAATRLPTPLLTGPVKLVVADYSLPSLDDLVEWIGAAHDAGRPVAVHCVSRVGLALALAAWDEAGARPGDRVEHGSVVPPALRSAVAAKGLTVVTQPGFVQERGDRYLVEVDADDLPHLYPCRSLIEAGIPVGGSTDAPYGHPDPWRDIATAVDRRTTSGQTLGAREAVSPERALSLFLTPPGDPGGAPRRVEVGAPADLVLLDGPLSHVLEDPSSRHVTCTVIAGDVIPR